MDFQRINATDAEKVFMRGNNDTGAAVSSGHSVCWHTRTQASANGIDISTPVTSNLPAFAGIADADIADNAAGPVQVYGFTDKAFVSASGGETMAPGQVVGPVDAQDYLNSSGISTNLGPCIIMSQRVGGNAANPVFIRAL